MRNDETFESFLFLLKYILKAPATNLQAKLYACLQGLMAIHYMDFRYECNPLGSNAVEDSIYDAFSKELLLFLKKEGIITEQEWENFSLHENDFQITQRSQDPDDYLNMRIETPLKSLIFRVFEKIKDGENK